MPETLAQGGRMSLGRWVMILVWAIILTLAPGIAGVAVVTAVSVIGDFVFVELATRCDCYEPLLVKTPVAVLAATVVALGTYVLAVRLGEKRWPSELAPASAIPGLGMGIILAVSAFGLLMGVLILSGDVVWRSPAIVNWRWALDGSSNGALGGLLLGLAVQGGGARLATQAFGPVVGVALAALLASWLVSFVEELPPLQWVNVALGGAILGLFWLRYGRLWPGLGLSTGWGALSGVVIAGSPMVDGGDTSIYEPGRGHLIAWLRGTGGPENSVPLLAGCVLAAAFLAWRAWKEGRFSDT
ncbi:hypothetical protein V7S57_16920 [Caulobacter sp. CCNWLY153]|uniref:hypothetical protein n=1 Tax=unclassified Caulobacter TaxID=2648921 RepID=UPI002FEEB92B